MSSTAPQAVKRSPTGAAISGRLRPLHVFDVAPFLCMTETKARVAIRMPRMREQNRAIDGAKAHVAKRAKDNPAVALDPQIEDDARLAYLVSACAFEADRTDGLELPLWPTGEDVISDLTVDEIAVFVYLINEVRAKLGPNPESIEDEKVEAYASMAALLGATDKPDEMLTPLRHAYLVQLYILTAVKLAEARQEIAEHARALEALSEAAAEDAAVAPTEAPPEPSP